MKERPRGGLTAWLTGYLDNDRCVDIQRALELHLERSRGRGAQAHCPEAFPQLDEIRIGQLRPEKAAAVLFKLVAPHIAIAAVVEHDTDEIDPVLNRGREFLHAKQKSAIAAHGHDPLVGIGDLNTQRGVKAKAEIILVTTGHILPRSINRKTESRRKTNLRNLLHVKAITRQHVADRVDIVHLGLNHLNSLARPRLDTAVLRLARTALADERLQRIDQ